VRDHPEKFEEAYWEVRGLKWFQKMAEAKRDVGDAAFVKSRGRYYRE
jgi:hypothetical protein